MKVQTCFSYHEPHLPEMPDGYCLEVHKIRDGSQICESCDETIRTGRCPRHRKSPWTIGEIFVSVRDLEELAMIAIEDRKERERQEALPEES